MKSSMCVCRKLLEPCSSPGRDVTRSRWYSSARADVATAELFFPTVRACEYARGSTPKRAGRRLKRGHTFYGPAFCEGAVDYIP